MTQGEDRFHPAVVRRNLQFFIMYLYVVQQRHSEIREQGHLKMDDDVLQLLPRDVIALRIRLIRKNVSGLNTLKVM